MFEYVFDTSEVRGQRVTVTAAMRLRHLPPYFLRGLDGFYPDGLTSEALLSELIISTVEEDRSAPKRVPQPGSDGYAGRRRSATASALRLAARARENSRSVYPPSARVVSTYPAIT